MWNADKLEKLLERRRLAEAGGGASRIEKQHASGKMTARERMEALFDDGTFAELNSMAESCATDFGMDQKRVMGDGVVTGYGLIHGRAAFASAQDFTVSGGSLGEMHAKKICHVMDMAMAQKAPFISINDSGGARIEEGILSLNGYAEIFLRNVMASGVIPQLSVVMGPCAGGACYSPAICDFIFMTEATSQMYITGPQVVKAVTGETVTPAELGGAAVHTEKSGVAHFVYPDDESCLNGVRRLLSYLPQNCQDYPVCLKAPLFQPGTDLTDIVPESPTKGYDVHEVIEELIDRNTFLEVQSGFAPNIVVGLARLNGAAIGLVANQPNHMGGSLDFDSADKAARFIRFCDCFHIPLVSLVDVPAFMPGCGQEHSGIIRHGAKLLYAFAEATVPKVCLIMRKAYGGAYIAMNSKGLGADIVYAWPIAEIAVMGAEGAVNIIGKKQIDDAADKAAEREKLIREYNDKFMTPYIAAARGYVDEVILPKETREKISAALAVLKHKQKCIPERKHGNIPL